MKRENQKEPEVIYQDDSLLILDKPSGLVTLRTISWREDTLQDFTEKSGIFIAGRGGIVHRLDKETSGIVIVAKNELSFADLQRQFKERKVAKTYLALVNGEVTNRGEIAAPVGRSRKNRFNFAVAVGGKPAFTAYRLIKRIKVEGEDYSLLEIKPKTGRTHQIRVHLKYLGHPLFGDTIYGSKREQGRPLFLVAKAIEFTHPTTGRLMKFEISLPDYLKKIIEENEN